MMSGINLRLNCNYEKTSTILFIVIGAFIVASGVFYRVDFLWNTLSDYLIFYSLIGGFCLIFGLVGWVFRVNFLWSLLLATALIGQRGGSIGYFLFSQVDQEESITVMALGEANSGRGTYLRGVVLDCCYMFFVINTVGNAKGLPKVENGDVCTLKVKKFYIQYMVVSINCRKPDIEETT